MNTEHIGNVRIEGNVIEDPCRTIPIPIGSTRSEIQALVDDAPTGSIVVFESGTYDFDEPLRIRKSLSLHGTAPTVLSGPAPLIKIENSSHLSIRDFTMERVMEGRDWTRVMLLTLVVVFFFLLVLAVVAWLS